MKFWPPNLQAARAFAMVRGRELVAAARRHPVRAAFVLPALMLLYVLVLIPFTPGIGDLRKAKSATPSVVMSSDGVVLAEYKRINRQWVPLEKIAPSVVEALIATEDRRFYDHFGIDLRRTVAALWSSLFGDLQGGSTITQQLARNLYIKKPSQTFGRKATEACLAIKLARKKSKQWILQAYVNQVFYGNRAYGVEAASQTYFSRHASQLTLPQAALLAGLPQQPSVFDPFHRPQEAIQRRDEVLGAMLWPLTMAGSPSRAVLIFSAALPVRERTPTKLMLIERLP